MELQLYKSYQPCKWVHTENMISKPGGFFRVSRSAKQISGSRMFMTVQSNRRIPVHHKPFLFKVSSSLKDTSGPVLSDVFPSSLNESLVVKKKSAEVEKILNASCIYLVGMMGSGKTTIGRVLSEALGYSFCDSDLLVEQTMGGMSVADIFKQYGETFFRDKETEALKELSMMNKLVVSTGGGAVIRPINWKHMRSGVSVWLDVPVDCLARRISAVGTGSRPLLHGESGDAYSKAFTRLSKLLEERGESYANADTRVSFEHIASKLGNVNVDKLSPHAIAIEVVEQIENFLKNKDDDLIR